MIPIVMENVNVCIFPTRLQIVIVICFSSVAEGYNKHNTKPQQERWRLPSLSCQQQQQT